VSVTPCLYLVKRGQLIFSVSGRHISSGICPWIVVEFCGALNLHVLTFVTISGFPFLSLVEVGLRPQNGI